MHAAFAVFSSSQLVDPISDMVYEKKENIFDIFSDFSSRSFSIWTKVESNSRVYKMKAQFVLLLVSLFVLTSANNFSKKCCPHGSYVELEDFRCIATKNLEAQSQVTERTIDDDNGENWPTCDTDETHFVMVENSFDVTGHDFCVDLTKGNKIVEFYCENGNDTINGTSNTTLNQKSFEIYPVNKCCPMGMKYDYENRTCVESLNLFSSSLIFSDRMFFEIYQLPKCGVDNSLVEYHSSVHKIKLKQNLLSINDRLVEGSFCTEETTSGEMVAKVCESSTICSKIPCIRKCCNERQIFDTTVDEIRKCEDYEYDLVKIPFYNFTMGDDLQSDTPPIMELTGKLIGNRERSRMSWWNWMRLLIKYVGITRKIK